MASKLLVEMTIRCGRESLIQIFSLELPGNSLKKQLEIRARVSCLKTLHLEFKQL
jgi:hypothetical protein